MKARIVGLGSYLPEKILTNFDLEKLVDTSDEWIKTRTGISERRIAREDQAASDMGYLAAEKALEMAGKTANQIDLIIVATMTPDYVSPSTAVIIQSKLKAANAAAFDMQAACSGFIYALSTAKAYVESGMYQNILVVATEKMSAFLDFQDRNTCILFGDGASAVVVSNKGKGFDIENVCLGAEGDLAELIMVNAGGSRNPTSQETLTARDHYIRMTGKEVFKHAVRRMTSVVEKCLETSKLTQEEISWYVPHQANGRIMDALAKQFRIPEERICRTVHKYGNTSGSSVAITLEELIREKIIEENEHIICVAFGAGVTWGATLLTKRES